MNAKELMNRDLVRQKFSELQLRVHSVTPPYILAYGEEGRFHEDSIEPIPITPEILKKNGFILSEKDGSCEVYEYMYDDTFMQIMFYLKDKIIIVRIEKYNYESEYYMNALHNCEIKYIHKLQHAMRLCGINKEIILEE